MGAHLGGKCPTAGTGVLPGASRPTPAVDARGVGGYCPRFVVDRLRRVPAWAWALLFSVAIALPRLTAFGLWEPWELTLAEQARVTAEGLTAGKAFQLLATAQLIPLMRAVGVKLFGATELGVRLFSALTSVAALMAVYWAGLGLFRRRAALIAVLVLGATPLFALSARQVTTDMPLVAALSLTLGALGRWAWPADGRRRALDLGLGLVGLAAGYASGGAIVGAALPCLALVLTVIVCLTLDIQPAGGGVTAAAGASEGRAAEVTATPADVPATETVGVSPATVGGAPEVSSSPSEAAANDGTGALSPSGAGPDLPAGATFGSTFRKRGQLPLLGLGLLAVAALALAAAHRQGFEYSALWGGTPRMGPPGTTFEYLIKQLGFGLFPFSAVAFFALGRPLIRLDDEDGLRTNRRLAFAQTYLLLFAGLGFALSTLLVLVLGECRFAALPALGLAMGAFIDEALEGTRAEPVTGLLIATGTLVLSRDLFQSPEDLVSVHLLGEKVKWPPSINVGDTFLLFGVLVAAGVYAGLAARGQALGKVTGPDMTKAPRWLRFLEKKGVVAGRWGLQVAVGLSVVFGFWMTQFLVPKLSTQLSFKPMMESYAKYGRHGEKFGRYRIEGKGTGFYSGLSMIELPTQDRLVAFLRDPSRVFALVPTEELASLDTALKTAHVPYYAVSGKSSRFLLLSNQLETGEPDENPLLKYVWAAPTSPLNNGGQWNPAEKPPWTWRVPLSATFGDAIEVVGANFPETIRRPGKLSVELIFRAKAKVPPGYKIFIHVDGPASPRLNGDHDPVGKAFPTANWLPGEYIRDVYDIDAPLMTTPAGTYKIFFGFWPGGEGRRLHITQGPNDGADRLYVGTVEIK